MAHVVMQAAEFASTEAAERCERELRSLVDDYVRFEASDPSPWATDRVSPPLTDFGRRHGVEWPNEEASRFLIKGLFADEARVMCVDRMVFFWAGGFDLGGPTLRAIIARLGAIAVASECHLSIRHDAPDARIAELAGFLEDEDLADQFTIDDGAGDAGEGLFSITVVGPHDQKRIVFDDSGSQDWAFVALVPQLTGDDPALHAPDVPGTGPEPSGRRPRAQPESPAEAAQKLSAAADEPEAALAAWLRLIERLPHDITALQEATECFAALGRDDEADALIIRLLTADPGNGSAQFVRGLRFAYRADHENALAAFTTTEGCTCDPAVAVEARKNRIVTLHELGRNREALALEYGRGEPKTADDFDDRALAEVKAGEYAACIASVGRAVELRPRYAMSHYTLACAHALRGDRPLALAAIARAVELDPDLAPEIADDPDFTGLVEDPEFRRLVEPDAEA